MGHRLPGAIPRHVRLRALRRPCAKLYLARDRVGIKPLFYHHTPLRLVFSSEIPSLLAAGDVPRELNPEALSGYFRYQYVPAPETIYKNLYKLEPGCYLEVDTRTGRLMKERYWKLRIDLVDRSEEDWLEQLDALLDETIRLHVRCDVPFGAFLSGGVDSSLVTALASRRLNAPVRTFTIGFQEEQHSELPYAAEASRAVGTRHREKVISADLAIDVLRALAARFGEPFADSSAIPCYYVAREAAREVKMVLSGDGGDELFGGYVSYQTTFRDLSAARASLPALLVGLLDRGAAPTGVRQWMRERALGGHRAKHDASRQIFAGQALRDLLVPEVPVAPPVAYHADVSPRGVDPVNYFASQDFGTYLVDDVLTKVDRTSMANSLEVRVPLLDHKVVEMAFSMPLAMKIRLDRATGELEAKYVLKRLASRWFSRSFLARPKQGFGIPIVPWCRGPWRAMIEAELRDRQSGIYDFIRFRMRRDHARRILRRPFRIGGKDLVRVHVRPVGKMRSPAARRERTGILGEPLGEFLRKLPLRLYNHARWKLLRAREIFHRGVAAMARSPLWAWCLLAALAPTNFVLSIRCRDVKYENSVLHISFMVHIPYYATRLLRRLGMKADYLAMEESTKIWDKADYVFVPRGVPAVQVWQEFLFFWRVVARYEVIHSHFGMHQTSRGWEYRILKRMGRKIVIHFRGCEVRDRQLNMRLHPEENICENCDYHGSICTDPVRRRRRKLGQRFGDLILVTTPDMNDFLPGAVCFPFFLPDIRQEDYLTGEKKWPEREEFRIVHVTGHPGIEGTDEIRRAIDGLRAKGYPVSFRFLHLVGHDQVLREIAAADLTIGKMKMGHYANAQIESMLLGVPAVTHLRREFMTPELERSGFIFTTLAELEGTLEHYLRHPEELERKRKIARSSILELHDNERLGKRMIALYRAA